MLIFNADGITGITALDSKFLNLTAYIALAAGVLGFLIGLTSKTKSTPKQIEMVDLFKQPE